MTSRAPQIRAARVRAAQVTQDYNLEHLPVDPIALARNCNIVVEAKPAGNDGISGMLARVGETYGILYATHIPSAGFQRFSVAHELGHFFIDGHMDQLLSVGSHVSRANFASPDPYEVEADIFAACLLMPEGPFKRELARQDDGLEAVLALADLCCTSLTATAVRSAQVTRSAVAVIQSTNGVVEFCILSEALKTSMKGWLKRGDEIPSAGPTHLIAGDRKRLESAAREGDDAQLNRWFSRAPALPIHEEAIGLGRFGRVLTVVHCPRLSLLADGYEDEQETDEDVLDRWTPRFS